MVMREAETRDCRVVYELSNDPLVRSVSFSTEPIAWEEHVQWYEGKLVDSDSVFLLFFSGQSLAAQIRFSRIGSDTAEVSISVSAEYRGKGMAIGMMGDALSYLKNHWHIEKIRAMVKKENQGSNRFFVKAGYVFSFETQIKGSECNVYFYNYQ